MQPLNLATSAKTAVNTRAMYACFTSCCKVKSWLPVQELQLERDKTVTSAAETSGDADTEVERAACYLRPLSNNADYSWPDFATLCPLAGSASLSTEPVEA